MNTARVEKSATDPRGAVIRMSLAELGSWPTRRLRQSRSRCLVAQKPNPQGKNRGRRLLTAATLRVRGKGRRSRDGRSRATGWRAISQVPTMVMHVGWKKALTLPILCLVLLTGCQHSLDQYAFNMSLPFSVTWESERLVIRDGDEVLVVDADIGEVETGWHVEAKPLTRDSFAFATSTHLSVVSRDGSVKSIPLATNSVVAAGDRILVGLESVQPGSDYLEIGVFDSSLRERDRFEIRKLQERETSTPANLLPDSIMLVAGGKDAFWVGYRTAVGVNRGGPWWLVKHDYGGEILASVQLDGLAYESVLSPDGRYLAVFACGSSGACYTVRNLRVVDLDRMTLLETAPDVPAQSLARSADAQAPHFNGRVLRWVDERTLIAEGIAADGRTGDCDQGLGAWRRTFSVDEPGLIDEPLDESLRDSRAWIGPGCDDVITSTSDGSGLIITKNGQTTSLPKASLAYGAAIPDTCR